MARRRAGEAIPSYSCDSLCFFFSSRRRHTRLQGDWSSDVCSSDLLQIDRRNVRRDISRRDDRLEALELRHVHDGWLLFRLLLLFLVEEDHRRVDRPLVFLLTCGQRRDDSRKYNHAVSDQRYNAETKRTLLIGLPIGLDQVVEHRRLLRAGGLVA